MDSANCFAATGIGMEDLAAAELKNLGILNSKVTQAGISFTASWEEALKALLWLRTPSRLLWELYKFAAVTTDDLYAAARAFPWENHLDAKATFAISVSEHKSKIEHTQYALYRLKDAIVDRLQEVTGSRPSIDRDNPGLALHLHLGHENMTISIDLSAGSLHRRGLRAGQHEAPLKENLAAAILLRAAWPTLAEKGYNFVDPLCGGGTLVFEAAMMAANIAPGLYRPNIGFRDWKKADLKWWEELKAAAHGEQKELKIKLFGSDSDEKAILMAKKSAAILSLGEAISFAAIPLEKVLAKNLYANELALMATNPPYGRRLGRDINLRELYKNIGLLLTKRPNWNGAIITEEEELGHAIGISASKKNRLYNGPNPCLLLHFLAGGRQEAKERHSLGTAPKALTKGAEMVANRLSKNLKELKRWSQKEGVTSYRLYDADMPEYAAAIDYYEEKDAVVWEYAAPKSVDEKAAERRFNELIAALKEATSLDEAHIHIKKRRKVRGGAAGLKERHGEAENYVQIYESPAKLLVNFDDYLDTGIFLDHRLVRRKVRELAAGRRFINLFCYTASATVMAALSGAKHSVSVDTSATYLRWARKNLNLNLIDPKHHELIRADVMSWLDEDKTIADVILIDAPTFSNSKSRETTFDVERDHVTLITKAYNHLAPGGTIIFSCNYKGFSFNEAEVKALGLSVREISAETVPFDFRRHKDIHRAFLLKDEDN